MHTTAHAPEASQQFSQGPRAKADIRFQSTQSRANISSTTKKKASLVDRGDKFVVQAELAFVVHGTYTPNGGDPVSIICLSHTFISTIHSRQFRKATIKLQFYSSNTSKPGPEVIEVHPINKCDKITYVKKQYVSSTSFVIGNKDGNGTPRICTQKVRVIQKGNCAVIKGEKKCSSPKKPSANWGENTAFWTVLENKNSPGIPRFRTITLLKRSDHEKFFAKLEIEAHVDFRQRLRDRWETWRGRMEDIKPVCFDPKVTGVEMGEVPKGLEVGNLRKFWDECLVAGNS
ncbi:hypothetical protein L211DRAFT_85293 [Terfezia boudieri ATCC MYA-4762]|uniref:Uncharacterized protein n=1 Tax=Terfezia boudieri ATCC MYA-4762 TaxID=1051890 RepID=A0A3N4LXW2_9PEZI|nr:hypothetical protein L211DRAFT_85293 [Terfezia boudieri ATCC MYA-4762]